MLPTLKVSAKYGKDQIKNRVKFKDVHTHKKSTSRNE